MSKKYCDCGKLAKWWYLASNEENENPFSCDDCVPRGCSCNREYVNEDYKETFLMNQNQPTKEDEPYIWIIENEIWAHVDEKGREYPCCEWGYDNEENNFENY